MLTSLAFSCHGDISLGTDIPKQQNKIPIDEPQSSDDDDFPDEQEIFQANGLLKLQKNLSGPVS